MRILLTGNPNVGKSALFSRLTGTHVVVSNYSGTTVEYTKGSLLLPDSKAEIFDTPGTFSLNPSNKAEEVTQRMLDEGDLIINVVDATRLDRSLYLTLQLIEAGKPMILVLNMWDEALKENHTLQLQELEKLLGIPVVTTCALTGEGIPELKSRLQEARSGTFTGKPGTTLWEQVEEVIKKVSTSPKKEHPLSLFSEWSVHPILGPVIALFVLFLSFAFVALFGDWLHEEILDEMFDTLWLPVVTGISDLMGNGGILHDVIIGNLIDGEIDFEESFGLLTTGLFIPIAVVLPFIFTFYVALSILEDVGYLPRLGVVIDSIMHQLGLHGLSIVPLMIGIGCNVPGVMAGRVLETKKERFIAGTLITIAVPCMAQQAMVIGLLGKAGITGLFIVYATLFVVLLVVGAIMNKFLSGERPEMLIDLPPYRLPYWKSTIKKLYMRTRGFIVHALPYVLLGVLIVNIFYTMGIIDAISSFFSPVITTLFGLPGEAGAALIAGFLRKDVAVGMLAPMGLDLSQLIVASVVLMVYFPCIATFVILFKELGWRELLLLTGIMLLIVVVTGTGLNLLLNAISL
ncbi:ferrous iron transporter B [Balneolaceae bacterium ANBcel3]|nr:ferrous iron transporter B [Balneolaceae bacterium ANBcel3]